MTPSTVKAPSFDTMAMLKYVPVIFMAIQNAQATVASDKPLVDKALDFVRLALSVEGKVGQDLFDDAKVEAAFRSTVQAVIDIQIAIADFQARRPPSTPAVTA